MAAIVCPGQFIPDGKFPDSLERRTQLDIFIDQDIFDQAQLTEQLALTQ